MDPIVLINLLRIVGYTAILPALFFIVWTIIHAARYLPKKRINAPEKEKEPKPQATPKPQKVKQPKPPKPPKVKEPKEPKVKEPKKPKEAKQVNEPQKQTELPQTDDHPPVIQTKPQPAKKTIHIRKPDAAKQVEEIWSQVPTAGAGWEGSPLLYKQEGGQTP